MAKISKLNRVVEYVCTYSLLFSSKVDKEKSYLFSSYSNSSRRVSRQITKKERKIFCTFPMLMLFKKILVFTI